MEYRGVYNSAGAQTHKGTVIKSSKEDDTPQVNLLKVDTPTTRGRAFITSNTLDKADLNVAKIRMLSTVPERKSKEEVYTKAFVGFILTGVQEAHAEKVEIVPLPGESLASYFFGAQPRQYAFQGILLNTEQDKWRDAFEQMYLDHLRGSASARNFSIVQVSYDNRVVSGWLTSFSQQVNSNSDLYSSFSFQMLVSRSDIIGGNGKLYNDYLGPLGDNLEAAQKLLNTDYNVLNADNIDGLIDKVNTAVLATPKNPRRGGKRSKSPGCSKNNLNTLGKKKSHQVGSTTTTDFRTSARCSTVQYVKDAYKEITDLEKKKKKLLEEGVPSTTKEINKRVEEIDKLTINIQNKRTRLGTYLSKEETKAEVASEYQFAIDDEIKHSGDNTLFMNKEINRATKGADGYTLIQAQIKIDENGNAKVNVDLSAKVIKESAKVGATQKETEFRSAAEAQKKQNSANALANKNKTNSSHIKKAIGEPLL